MVGLKKATDAIHWNGGRIVCHCLQLVQAYNFLIAVEAPTTPLHHQVTSSNFVTRRDR